MNDTLGHPAGDALLKDVAARLLDCVRKTDTVARLGGDEFAIIACNARNESGIEQIAQRTLKALATPFDVEGNEIRTGTSIGVTIYPHDKGDTDRLIRNADLALYRAKDETRGTIRIFDEQLDVEMRARREMEQDLVLALARSEFHMVYQPQFDIGSGQIIGAEALLRWQHPTKGMVPPSEFIPVAEATRLIIPISEWLLKDVCATAKAWQDSGLHGFPVSVNLSPLHFRRESLAEEIQQILARSSLDPCWLELEITESMAMASGEATKGILDGLREVGVRVAIDDFGTGYSSLNRLKAFPVERLKIDQSFVRDIATDVSDAAICSAIIQLGHSLNLGVIAEGVETRDQIEYLSAQGCDQVQGFLLSKPLGADDFVTFVSGYLARPLLAQSAAKAPSERSASTAMPEMPAPRSVCR